MRLLTKNILEDNLTVSMTNPSLNTSLSVENIYANALEEVAQATSGATVITVTFSAPQIVDCIFFAYHNLNSLTVVFYNSLDAVLKSINYGTPEQKVKDYFDTISNVYKIELTLAASTPAYIGNFACGRYAQLYNVGTPIKITNIDKSYYLQSRAGQVQVNTRNIFKQFQVTLNKNTQEEGSAFIAAYDAARKGKTFWLDRFEDTTKEALFMYFDKDYTESEYRDFTTYTFSVMEAR